MNENFCVDSGELGNQRKDGSNINLIGHHKLCYFFSNVDWSSERIDGLPCRYGQPGF